ncbi:MAG TPA: ferredoxin [Mycobacteriales bacterium]|nr:ferredoxin [Mycobacteriales bacterium]
MKVTIDKDRCSGHGRCYVLAPALVTDDAFGYGEIVGDGDVAPGQEEAARHAAEACPEQAFTVTE